MNSPGEAMQTKVMHALKESRVPKSAYDILAQLKQENSKLAPTTVYRALTALMDQGQVHKVEGLNAFTVCRADHAHEPALLAICDSCGQVDETVAPNLAGAAKDVLQDRGFAASRHVFEVHGQCGSCSIAEGAA